MSEWNELVRQRREQMNVSQQELADSLGISRNYLSQIETGKATNLSWFLRCSISRALGIEEGLEITRKEIFQAIGRERDYQDKKWGTIYERPHTVGEWLLIAHGELNEAIQAWQKNTSDDFALQELLQVVAVGVACMEQWGVKERSH